jgi:hypothetical protein
VGRPWGGRWHGLDHLLVKCALAHLAAKSALLSLCFFGVHSWVSQKWQFHHAHKLQYICEWSCNPRQFRPRQMPTTEATPLLELAHAWFQLLSVDRYKKSRLLVVQRGVASKPGKQEGGNNTRTRGNDMSTSSYSRCRIIMPCRPQSVVVKSWPKGKDWSCRGGGGPQVEILCACFRCVTACILPVWVD